MEEYKLKLKGFLKEYGEDVSKNRITEKILFNLDCGPFSPNSGSLKLEGVRLPNTVLNSLNFSKGTSIELIIPLLVKEEIVKREVKIQIQNLEQKLKELKELL